ncbi:MAG TPA: DNA helicase UvrD, partial [Candidatus Nanoarchaeia archaeon]|nr:DNA helicase UvrD [Candidatus Nanoarchaeia archaeon]
EMLPLHEVISLVYGTGIASVKCWKIYNSLIEKFKNEFNILIDVPESKFIENEIDGELIRYILLNREGKIKVKPGYDGVYGKALLEDKQATLF